MGHYLQDCLRRHDAALRRTFDQFQEYRNAWFVPTHNRTCLRVMTCRGQGGGLFTRNPCEPNVRRAAKHRVLGDIRQSSRCRATQWPRAPSPLLWENLAAVNPGPLSVDYLCGTTPKVEKRSTLERRAIRNLTQNGLDSEVRARGAARPF